MSEFRGAATFTFFIIFLMLFAALPFIINFKLAKSRGKSVPLMMLLTLIFSWIVTLILAFHPKVNAIVPAPQYVDPTVNPFTWRCWSCTKFNKVDAFSCIHCGVKLNR